tara:strand:+ start:32 stop:301 length:270 start_codon:yes stop_codon:yes gene_type:complete
MEQSNGVVSVKLTLKELNEIVTDAQMEAEEIMRNKIVKYINEGYTTTGIMYMLGKFNLVTGEAHDVKLDYDMSLPIIVKEGSTDVDSDQ